MRIRNGLFGDLRSRELLLMLFVVVIVVVRVRVMGRVREDEVLLSVLDGLYLGTRHFYFFYLVLSDVDFLPLCQVM